ncbi:hypothetical protein BKA80DRAFT_311801 [Phyllosticta citrichinensis]
MGVWEQEFRNQLKRSTSFDLLIAKVRAGKYLNRNASESSGKASTAIARAHLQAVQNNMLPYLMQMSDCAQEAPNSVCVAAYDEVLRLLNKGNGVVQPYQLRNIIKAMKNVSNLRAQHRAQQASESSPHQLATAQKATVSSVGDPGLESAAKAENFTPTMTTLSKTASHYRWQRSKTAPFEELAREIYLREPPFEHLTDDERGCLFETLGTLAVELLPIAKATGVDICNEINSDVKRAVEDCCRLALSGRLEYLKVVMGGIVAAVKVMD